MIVATVSIPHKYDTKVAFRELPQKGHYLDFGGSEVYQVESVWHKYYASELHGSDEVIPSLSDIRIVTVNT